MVSCPKARSPPTSPPLQLHDYHLDHIPRRHQQNEISKQECQAICVFLVHTLPRVVLLWIELDTVTKFHFCLVSSWSNIFSKVKSIFCPDQELGIQPKRNDKHLFLPGQPQHPRQQVQDQSKMLGFSISHSQFPQLLHLLLRLRGIPLQLQRSRQNPLLVERAAFQETTIHNIRDHRNLKYLCSFFFLSL